MESFHVSVRHYENNCCNSHVVHVTASDSKAKIYIYTFIALALDESIFLDVLHFPMKNIKSHDLEATPMDGASSDPASDVVCLLLLA